MPLFYRAVTAFFRGLNRIAFGVKITNKKQIKQEGRVVIVSNHSSVWDPLFIAPEFRIQAHYLAKAELFTNKFLAYIFTKGLGAIPVKRGEADYGALKRSIQLLRDDRCLGVFPEGTRVKDEIGEFQRGFAAIAIKANAQVLPAYIDGDYKLFKKMHLIIGDRIDLSTVCDLKQRDAAGICADYIRNQIIALREEHSIYK
jgi:1-acyl-sn-glycerol-3-phosphate acyltransferase